MWFPFTLQRSFFPKVIRSYSVIIPRIPWKCYWGHFETFTTYKRLASKFYWEGMTKDIQKMVAVCEECNTESTLCLNFCNHSRYPPKYGQISQWISTKTRQHLMNTQSSWSLCRISTYAHFIPLKHPFAISCGDFCQ